MKKNMGSGDRVVRIVLAAIIAILYFAEIISGTAAIVLGVIALVFLLTSFVNFCPLYTVLGISTNNSKG